MGKANGSKGLKCPLCGEHYRRTNWMIRRGGAVVTVRGRVVHLTDTHLRKCYERRLEFSSIRGRT